MTVLHRFYRIGKVLLYLTPKSSLLFCSPGGMYIKLIIILSMNKYILIGPDAYPLESIKLHSAWFARRDVAKHMAQGNIDWLTGSDIRMSSNFT